MTKKEKAAASELCAKMEECLKSHDKEERHVDADVLLCEFVRAVGGVDGNKAVDMFEAADRWYA